MMRAVTVPSRRPAHRRLLLLGLLCVLCGLTGCSAILGVVRPRKHVPEALADTATIPGLPNVRTWGDGVSESYRQSLLDALRQEKAYHEAHPEEKVPETVDILVISGGGQNGAYSAGLLCGWTASGKRPQFRLVTGVSTGALLAPLAFLGPKCDEKLKTGYTTVSTRSIMRPRALLRLLRADSIEDTKPLTKLIAQWITPETLKEIAAEHAKGRRLLIGTTNLDAQRGVIWDMGAIASSGHPRALELFRSVMRASAAIPVAFPPVYFKVEAEGKTYDEMHVDGGVVANMFLLGAGLGLEPTRAIVEGAKRGRSAHLYVLRSGKVSPKYGKVKARLAPIALHTMDTMGRYQVLSDIARMYNVAQNEKMTFHLAHIPDEFDDMPADAFDPKYMGKLFDLAYGKAARGYPWKKTPPVMVGTVESKKEAP